MGEHQDIPESLKHEVEPLGLENVKIEDFAAGLLEDLDYDAQVMAIRLLLLHHRKDAKDLGEEIRRTEEYARKGPHGQRAVEEWVDLLHHSTYQEVAHSMAAVSMLAPLVESIFDRGFAHIRKEFFMTPGPYSGHPRWERAAKAQWDCHFVFGDDAGRPMKNLVEGIFELAECVGLKPHLPSDLKPTLEALFEYRNKMFYFGFEWPLKEREKFGRRIKQAGWPSSWFGTATTDGVPWIFYLTDTFADHCLERIDQIVDGMGAFALERWASRRTTG